MAQHVFEKGGDWMQPGDDYRSYDIHQKEPEGWAARIVVYGSAGLRDYILKLLTEHPYEGLEAAVREERAA